MGSCTIQTLFDTAKYPFKRDSTSPDTIAQTQTTSQSVRSSILYQSKRGGSLRQKATGKPYLGFIFSFFTIADPDCCILAVSNALLRIWERHCASLIICSPMSALFAAHCGAILMAARKPEGFGKIISHIWSVHFSVPVIQVCPDVVVLIGFQSLCGRACQLYRSFILVYFVGLPGW